MITHRQKFPGGKQPNGVKFPNDSLHKQSMAKTADGCDLRPWRKFAP
jgi:hypothetical protein